MVRAAFFFLSASMSSTYSLAATVMLDVSTPTTAPLSSIFCFPASRTFTK